MKRKLRGIKNLIEKELGARIDTPNRRRDLTYGRAIFCKVARECNRNRRPIALQTIGEMINRDHATVLHNINTIFNYAIQEHNFMELYETLKHIFVEEALEEEADPNAIFERINFLEGCVSELEQRLAKAEFKNGKFAGITKNLTEQDMEEIYEMISLRTRAIKSRQYV
jgi:hypothetical protein